MTPSHVGRREFLAALAAPAFLQSQTQPARTLEQWGIYEAAVKGPSTGNPFVDVQFGARFRSGAAEQTVDGFYDGDGAYRIRFMPDRQGAWTFETTSNVAELAGRTGSFECVAPSAGNHGPVRVRNTHHFGYADGTPYFPFGTTCYAWIHQGDQLEQQTLRTLRTAPFNKMRMCVFPKDYAYNANEPQYYPFERDPAGKSDFTRFNPAFFHHLEQRVRELLELGIEADLILLHPYDRWGYASMGADDDDRYLRYAVARLAAFRNVWWSMANEFNYMRNKTLADWDRFCGIVQRHDPYGHLTGVHNGGSEADVLYDHSKPWITHVSIQSKHLNTGAAIREKHRKPVVFDECFYEGNIPRRWGDISGHEMMHRFWLGTVNGCYVGHGETYLDPNDVLWWSKGGVLKGESPARIAFLRKIIEEAPADGLTPVPNAYYPAAGIEGKYYLHYLDIHQPREYPLPLPKEGRWSVDILDPWGMTVTPVAGTHSETVNLSLPGKPYMAIRVKRAV